MQQFSPEPWEKVPPLSVGAYCTIVDSNGDEICHVHSCTPTDMTIDKDWNDDEAEANARLIKAAPDMLYALELAQGALISLKGDYEHEIQVIQDAVNSALGIEV